MFMLGQTILDDMKNAVWNSLTQVWDQFAAYAPRVVAMVAVIVFGFVIAKLVAQFVASLSEKIGLQKAAERGGLVASMRQVGINRTVPAICGTIMFWLLMCVFLMAGFNILGLDALSASMQQLINFIPHLLLATVVVVIGLLVATFLRGVVATSADRAGVSYAELLANGCYYVLAILTFIAAFHQLGLEFKLLEQLILIADKRQVILARQLDEARMRNQAFDVAPLVDEQRTTRNIGGPPEAGARPRQPCHAGQMIDC